MEKIDRKKTGYSEWDFSQIYMIWLTVGIKDALAPDHVLHGRDKLRLAVGQPHADPLVSIEKIFLGVILICAPGSGLFL